MNAEFFKALEQLEAEKGIPKEYMIEKIEAALVSAYKREQGGSSNVRVFIDPAKKDVRVFQLREVVDNGFEEYNEINYIYLEDSILLLPIEKSIYSFPATLAHFSKRPFFFIR